MNTSKNSIFAKIKVQTSLILVLVFFFIMLVAGAVIGVKSLNDNNKAFNQIVAESETLSLLEFSVNDYFVIKSAIDEALTDIVINHEGFEQNNDLNWDYSDISLDSTKLKNSSISILNSISSKTKAAQNALKELNKQIQADKVKLGYMSSVTNTYSSLVNKEVPEAIESLLAGNLSKYEKIQKQSLMPLEAKLINEYQQLKTDRSNRVKETVSSESEQTQFIGFLVFAAILASLVFAIGCYIFWKKVVLNPLHRAGFHFDRIASGDLTDVIEVGSNNEIGLLYAAMQRMQNGLTNIVSSVNLGVEAIRVGAEQIFTGNTDLSSRTEQQAASLQQTAASMEQIASTVKQNAENANKANELALSVENIATQGGDAVHSVTNTMSDIRDSSQQISEIVNVIDSIAFQTNILALNAAVEAARAGEQGRGFAVVAGEVRSLAQRSSDAAKDVRNLIDETVNRIQQGATKIEQADKVMSEMVHAAQGVTTIMSEISSSSNEQSEGINQINRAVTEMDNVVQQNALLVQQATSAAGSLQDQAAKLDQLVSTFKLKSITS